MANKLGIEARTRVRVPVGMHVFHINSTVNMGGFDITTTIAHSKPSTKPVIHMYASNRDWDTDKMKCYCPCLLIRGLDHR